MYFALIFSSIKCQIFWYYHILIFLCWIAILILNFIVIECSRYQECYRMLKVSRQFLPIVRSVSTKRGDHTRARLVHKLKQSTYIHWEWEQLSISIKTLLWLVLKSDLPIILMRGSSHITIILRSDFFKFKASFINPNH